jgi:hypothetical protein
MPFVASRRVTTRATGDLAARRASADRGLTVRVAGRAVGRERGMVDTALAIR